MHWRWPALIGLWVFIALASTATAAPTYRFQLVSAHPGAVPAGYTYRGDTLRARMRDLNAETKRYKVCVRKNTRNSCARKTLEGRRWSTRRIKVGWRWAGYINNNYTGYVRVKWFVKGDVVKVKRIKVWE